MSSASSDFRTWVRELQEAGDIQPIDTSVDPHLELASVTRRCYENYEPAPLFNNIVGREGNGLFRVLGAPVGIGRSEIRYGRIAKSVGLPSNASAENIVNHLVEARDRPPIPPIQDDDVNLEALSVPLHHMQDGGKYIQTFGMFVVQSPDGNWTNWSITRGMVCGKRKIVAPIMPKQDIETIFQLWKDINQDMPFALAFGVPPAAIMVSGMPIPKWTDESENIGAVTGRGVEVTKCETCDLLVPTSAEIVMEGTVSRFETAAEGPMGEYHGMTFPSQSHQQPVFNVDAITYRDNPILPLCIAGRAPEENHTVFGLMQSVELLATFDHTRLVRMRTSMKAFCELVGHAVFQDPKMGWYIPKLYIVGEDVDPSKLEDLFWADSTRCEPGASEFLFHGLSTIPMVPYIAQCDRIGKGEAAKVIRCCLLPQKFTEEHLPWVAASFEGSFPEEVKDRVNKRWKEYGFR
ncbi:hypothetical protein M409DRAFT_71016 [Zasmidium cellare ATCC 36951]|uniref:Ferulic acid decarboxylase 1 n=1 Tax=Zasmidium cellare ATCC 36951 TaxID=1080233 RepID=A0A6A6C0X1_ZASCE|nr:uncharacterized protein M409DRAFT_71016 [Zasmidium cellare ATCC 36951]KAF2159459.1 hypothetical protein M409DRAFT_71016 [Zasmidium cellare ATCC 36951]